MKRMISHQFFPRCERPGILKSDKKVQAFLYETFGIASDLPYDLRSQYNRSTLNQLSADLENTVQININKVLNK